MSLLAEFIGWAVAVIFFLAALAFVIKFIARLALAVIMTRQWKKEEKR